LKPPLLLVIAGPAGSGKSTLSSRLVKEDGRFRKVITATTRAPRPGEQDGIDYHFLSPEEFDRRERAGEFLEWARVHGERRYGTLKSSVLEPLAAGQSLVATIDVQGVASLRHLAETDSLLRSALATVFIIVEPHTLDQRLRERGHEDQAEIERRLQTAAIELREASRFAHQILSADREADYSALRAIIARLRP